MFARRGVSLAPWAFLLIASPVLAGGPLLIFDPADRKSVV